MQHLSPQQSFWPSDFQTAFYLQIIFRWISQTCNTKVKEEKKDIVSTNILYALSVPKEFYKAKPESPFQWGEILVQRKWKGKVGSTGDVKTCLFFLVF